MALLELIIKVSHFLAQICHQQIIFKDTVLLL